MIEALIATARRLGASDLHLEPGQPPTFRIRGMLQAQGEPLTPAETSAAARRLVGERGWDELEQRGSYDGARTLSGVRCRLNALHSMRGVGLAIRLLPATLPTLEELNLHPELATLAAAEHGLVLISGPTGSGKSSTLAAMLEEINRGDARHIVTIEQPIEFALRPRRGLIRQREVGRDTPSFEQALRDCLREDPDVIMVGELRDAETIRLTLNAAETGHLVLATLHSADVVEALQRVVLAFAPEVQGSVAAQLAGCLRAVVCQRLRYREEESVRVPECQILTGSTGARALIRQQELHKLASVLDTGAADGMWSWDRYRRWLDGKTRWSRPRWEPTAEATPVPEEPARGHPPVRTEAAVDERPATPAATSAPALERSPGPVAPTAPVLVIDEDQADPAAVLSELERLAKRRDD